MSSTPPPNPPPPPPPRPERRAAASENPAHAEPILRRTVVKPAGIVPDPVDAAYVANRLSALTHELANLLDGSMRVINLARRSAGDEAPGQVSQHLETVYAAMLQMADLVRNSMAGLAPVGAEGLRRALGSAGSLAAAVQHAVNVMKPAAEERNIELVSEIGAELHESPAGPVYTVVINTVKNAIESIERSGHGLGRITVRAWMEAGRTGRCVGIEVSDDGEGPPEWSARRAGAGARSVFDAGVTGKPGGAGLGLSLCREVVEQLGGTIELSPRSGGGAVMRVRYPAPAPMTERRVG